MKSIRQKLALTFSSFMLLLILIGMVLNAFFIQKYYIYKNKSILVEKTEEIKVLYESSIEDFIDITDSLSRNEGISTIVLDKDLTGIYNSLPPKNEKERIKVVGDVLKFVKKNIKELDGEGMYTLINKGENTDSQLIYATKTKKGEFVVLRKTLKSITESANIASQFSLISGIILILIGSVFIYIISKKATKPIINMSKVAEDISNLSFDNKVTYTKDDELGTLGESINNISSKLSKNIDTLKLDVERRKELVRNISHELKSPIGIIKGYTEGLKYGVVKEVEDQRAYYDVIVSECDRMDNLVKELLNLSRLEASEYVLNKEEIILLPFLNTIKDRFQNVVSEYGATLSISCREDITLNCDKNLLDRAVTNYLSNAIKFTTKERRIEIEVKELKEGISIAVFNSGEPIDTKEIDNLWDVFYKADKSRKREIEGHGLGLSIVKLIAEKHGGDVYCKNTQGGVTFYITLPK